MAGKKDSISLLCVGDIMPGGVLPYQDRYMAGDVLDYMRQFDLRIGTLECGVGTDLPFDEVKFRDDMSNIYVRNEDLFRLQELDINVVTLANNHAFDLGLAGYENAVRQLDQLGIQYCGAGHNREEAGRPAVVRIKGKTLAFLGCMIDPPCVRMYHVASETDFGVFQVGIEELVKTVAELKTQYDYVFVLPHWGVEHTYYPPVDCKQQAMRLIDAGADAVIGSHPHLVNPVVRYKGKYIYYSMGNFLFPDKCIQAPRPMYYPASAEECHALKRVWTYPYRVQGPVVAVWRGRNRIGMMVELQLGRRKRIASRYRLTQLTAENVLMAYSSCLFRLRMRVLGVLMKLPRYYIVRRLLISKYNLFSGVLDKSKACNIAVEAEDYEHIG
ncbi:MAG: CapA family protein [Bacteroidales bacterium]|nr:CapA family protein [Bacteroidales bacterium]